MNISLTTPTNTETIRAIFERNQISETIFEVNKEAKCVQFYKQFSESMGMNPEQLKVNIEKKKRFLLFKLAEIEESVLQHQEQWMDQFVRLLGKVKNL